MLHKPAVISGIDEAAGYKKRLGLLMLGIYGVIYLAFIVINVVWPKAMGSDIVAGLSLAIVYGMALIIVAFILAVIYNVLCSRRERAIDRGKAADEGQA